MTVTYLKEGRIKVANSHDALLLALAGVELVNEWNLENWRFNGKEWGVFNEYLNTFNPAYLCQTLYVPAEVAKELVWITPSGRAIWDAGENPMIKKIANDNVHLIKHNDRWNLLPEIEME